MDSFDLLIIGGGIAGYSAAIYARRYRLVVGLIDHEFGGYAAVSGVIENYPGVPNVDGFALMEAIRKQAVDVLGTVVIEGAALQASGEWHCFTVRVGDATYQAKALILAMGLERRSLHLPHEAAYQQRGVHFCATCDGPVYTGKPVAVIGGGDSAVKSANQLADMGTSHVYLISREETIDRAEPINRDRLAERISAGMVTLIPSTDVIEYLGGPPLEGLRLSKSFSGSDVLDVRAAFMMIGATPRTALAKQLGVRLTERGEIDVAAETMQTNIDGVFAAGDICDAAWGFKQAITSAAQGAIAATSAYSDLSQHGGACTMHAIAIPPDLLPETVAS